jgi:hypothetical protein
MASTTLISVSSMPPSPAAPAVARAQQHKSSVGLVTGEPRNPWWPLGVAAGLLALALIFLPVHRPRRRLTFASGLAAGLLCVVSFALGCGGGGGGFVAPPLPPGPQVVPSTTTLSSTTPKVPQGMNATVTATVTSSKSPSGTVTFLAGGQIFPPVTLVNGTAQAQLGNLFVGTIPITAQYSGDANNLPSESGAFNQVITGSTVFIVTAQTGVNVHQVNVTATIQ